MMKKRQITTFILALGMMCMLAGCTDKQGSVGNPYDDQTALPDKEAAEEGAAEAEVTDGNKKQAVYFELVSNGVRFEIPKEYEITLSEEEKSVYMHDEDYRFEFVMLVQDGVFEDSLEDPDRLMDKAKKEDITIDKSVTIVEINGKQYAYFTYTYNDNSSTNTLIFTSLGENKKLGINLVRYADISEEDIVRQLDIFLSTAKETEQPDTTIADLAKQDDKMLKDAPGELLESVKYEVQDKSLTTNVADGYYLVYDHASEETAGMLFSNLEETIDVSTMYFAENYYDKAEDYVEEQLSMIDESDPDYSEVSISKIRSITIGGLHVAYGDVSFVYDGNENSHLYAATILDDNSLYTMDVKSAYGEELLFDHFKAFFE